MHFKHLYFLSGKIVVVFTCIELSQHEKPILIHKNKKISTLFTLT